VSATGSRLPNQTTLLAIAIAIAVAATTTAAVSLTTLNHLKDAVITTSLRGLPLSFTELAGTLGMADAVLIALATAAMAMLLWLELRHRACSRLLATASDTEAFALLTILVAWFGHSYLSPGVLLARIIHRTARNRPRPPNTWARDFIAKNFIKQPIRIVVNDINGLALTAHFS